MDNFNPYKLFNFLYFALKTFVFTFDNVMIRIRSKFFCPYTIYLKLSLKPVLLYVDVIR